MPEQITYTETALLEGLQAHDEQVFSYLYDNYSKALFNIILQVVQKEEVAEEVLQDVFVKIWQNINSYDTSKGRLYTWMLNIARNSAIDKLRSKEFNKQSKTTELSDNVHNVSDSQRVDDAGLKRTISKLPEENRKLMELAYFQGYTQEEISKIMGIPLGTVKTRVRNTLIQLRKIVGVNN